MSTTPTTEHMNEIIGRFMGCKMYDKRYPRNHGVGAPEAAPEKCMIIQKAKYHTSWDALMPVCKKIKAIKYPEMISLMTAMKATQEMNNGLVSLDLERTHKGVYEFITWFNQQKQTNEQSAK